MSALVDCCAALPWGDVGRGAALGLAVAVPVGPTALLCIQRTAGSGMRLGLATGLASATVNALYAAVAALGFAAVAAEISPWGGVLKVCCAAFLLRLGWQAARRPLRLGRARGRRLGCWGAYGTALLFCLANPMSLIGFLTLTPVFLGPGAHGLGDLPLFVSGVLLGAAGWWTAVVGTVGLMRPLVTAGVLHRVNQVAGIALGGVAVSLLAEAVGWG